MLTHDQRRRWARMVLQSELTAAQKTVLFALETYADYRDGTNAHPGETRLAELCGMTTRAIRMALDRGKALGLIQRTERENPKAHKAAIYRLVAPGSIVGGETASTGTTVPVETRSTGTTVPVNNSPTGTTVPVETRSTGTTVPVNNSPTGTTVPVETRSTGTTVPVNNSPTGTTVPVETRSTGTAVQVLPERTFLPPETYHHQSRVLPNWGTSPELVPGAHTIDPPSPFCDKHPHGYRGSCGDCGNARTHRKAWMDAQAENDAAIELAEEERRRERRRVIAACPDCDDFGRLDDLSPCSHRGQSPDRLPPAVGHG